MIGPSSSHTAGAARIGLLARTLLGKDAAQAEILLHGSFAKTYKGHGTDRALVAGILGMAPDDERLRNALLLAEKKGLAIDFVPTDLDGAHPNTAEIHLTGKDGATASVRGASIGGGNILITRINDFPVSLTGEFFTLVVIHRDTPGAIAEVTETLRENSANICHFDLSRKSRGGEAIMSLSIDTMPNIDTAALAKKIEGLDNIYSVIALPAIG